MFQRTLNTSNKITLVIQSPERVISSRRAVAIPPEVVVRQQINHMEVIPRNESDSAEEESFRFSINLEEDSAPAAPSASPPSGIAQPTSPLPPPAVLVRDINSSVSPLYQAPQYQAPFFVFFHFFFFTLLSVPSSAVLSLIAEGIRPHRRPHSRTRSSDETLDCLQFD